MNYEVFTDEEQEFLLNLVCDYIFEYVYKTTSMKNKQLLLSILRKFGADDEYYTKILGG